MGSKLASEMKILAIVPAYNEEGSIVGVIEDLKSIDTDIDVLIINDGSKDNTADVAKSTGKAIVVSLVSNLGIGGAVQTGFKFAFKNNYDIALQFDGDGQHIASEIPKILNPLLSNEADMCIGSRFVIQHKGWKSSPLRRLGIRVFTALNYLLIKQRVTDSTSGFRAYNKDAIEFLAENYPQDYPEPETVVLMGKNAFRIKEIFTEMRERSAGESSISTFDAVYYMVKVVLAVLITSIRPRTRK